MSRLGDAGRASAAFGLGLFVADAVARLDGWAGNAVMPFVVLALVATGVALVYWDGVRRAAAARQDRDPAQDPPGPAPDRPGAA